MSQTQVTFSLPTDHVAWLVEVHQKPITDIARDVLIGLFEDERRKKCPMGRITIAFSVPLNNEMTKLCVKNSWGLSGFIRSVIYKTFRSKSPVFDKYKDWADRSEAYNSPAAERSKPRSENDRAIRAVMMPLDWAKWLKQNVDVREIKAEVQLEVEKLSGKKFPVQKGMGEWLNR